MNNSEAKQTILEADSCFCKHGAYKDCHSGCKYREALDAAVKALEQEPKTGYWVMPVQDDGMSAPIYYQVRCSECGFDLDPQTWHQELHQYGADKYCPNCGCAMKRE